MIKIEEIVRGFKTAEARWARFGPYYAMFPLDFAFDIVQKFSKKGDFIIDPFAGRCSSIYAGGVLGRNSLGIEINPVGWLYGSVKLAPADKNEVLDRLLEIYNRRNYYSKAIEDMPEFYRMCYCDEVLKFLLAARKNLEWKTNSVDATLMSILAVYLHGKLGEGLSNQMRMTKSMGTNYSVSWWRKMNMTTPPTINPLDFIMKKIEWRFKKGVPKVAESHVLFGDSTLELGNVIETMLMSGKRFSLLFTSPPYYSVTDYYNDQWLRLWLLGDTEIPTPNTNEKHKGRFSSKEDYCDLLYSVFSQCSQVMNRKSTVYVRTDTRDFTYETTFAILEECFPDYELITKKNHYSTRTQTEIMGNSSTEIGEVDIVLVRK